MRMAHSVSLKARCDLGKSARRVAPMSMLMGEARLGDEVRSDASESSHFEGSILVCGSNVRSGIRFTT